MNIDINDNITSSLLNLIYSNYTNLLEPLNILNISCDVSKSYKQLTLKYPNCNILNIEMDNFYSKNLTNVPNTILGNINNIDNIDNIDKNNYFDFIILDDTIEKFIQPCQLVQTLKNHLKTQGVIFASIPNIMHISNFSNLLNGKFTYGDFGHLNKDNLRFFTLNEIKTLFISNGYILENIVSVNTVETLESKTFIETAFPNADKSLKKQFNSYQYLVKASPKYTKTLFDYVFNKS